MQSDVFMCTRIQNLKTRIFELERQLEESERGRKANEHSMFSYMHQRDYLEKQRDELAIKLHASNTVIAALNIRVEDLSRECAAVEAGFDKLATEIAALRPPEPKFKVGQLAMPKNCVQRRALTLETPKWNNEGNYWVYPTHGWGAYDEKDLRELTAQEKGE